MMPVFPDNTPLYIRLKYQLHTGLTGEQQSRDDFVEFLLKDAYWYGVNSCSTAIKLYWLESQSWAQELFDEIPLPCADIAVSFFKPAKVFYSVREDLKDRYVLNKKNDFTGYLFDIYFGDSSREYCISSLERDYLSQYTSLLTSRLSDFQFCNAFYFIYEHKAKDSFTADIGSEDGQKLFVAYLFVNSKIWINKVKSTVVNQFFSGGAERIIEYIRLLFKYYGVFKNKGNVDVVSYLINNKHDMYVCQGMLDRLIFIQGGEIDGLSSILTIDNKANLFEQMLHSNNGELHATNSNILNIYSRQDSNGDAVISDDVKSFLVSNSEQGSFNVNVKRILSGHVESISSEILQYFIAHYISFSPLEIYAPVEGFLLNDGFELLSDSSGISIVGFSRSEIGTGEDARNTVKALSSQGCSVSVFNLIPDGSTYNHLESAVRQYEAQQLGYIQIYTMPPMIYMRQFLMVPLIHDAKGYKIGYFAWEFSEWKDEYNAIYEIFDEIWVISEFLMAAFSDGGVPVKYVPPVVTLSSVSYLKHDIRGELMLPKDKFLFLFVFDIKSSSARKNPIAAIKGFLSAFPGDSSVGLVLKFTYDEHDYNNNRDLFTLIDDDERIYLVSDMLSKSKIEALIHRCDAVVSLHRSEGFGRIIAEAMLLKTLVVCTGFSGNMDYCNDETALLVDYNLIKVGAGEYPFAEGLVWADVKHESVIEQMINARRDSDENRTRIENAYAMIVKNHSLESVARIMMQRLDGLCRVRVK